MRKINILLIIVLTATLGAVGYFGHSIYQSSRKVIVPDFLGKNVSEAIEWCGKLSDEFGCEFVYEESTTIDKDKVFKQSVSAESELTDKIVITVSSGLIQEIALPAVNENTSKTDIEQWAKQNNLVNVQFVEEENNDVLNGTIIRIEPQPVYPNSAVIVHIAKSTKEKESATVEGDEINVKAGAYIGVSEDEIKKTATSLGLKANHNSSRDDYSDSIEKGKVVWHGSGSYEKDETFNYGLSLGKDSSSTSASDLYITSGKYVGKTESEFKTIAENLTLKPNHKTEKDAYSDTVAKGSIVWHGSGQYEKNETFNYGLSLGKKSSSTVTEDDLYITAGKYVGKTESEFKTIAENLTLKPNHKSERDAYSDTVTKGNIVWHGSGQYVKDETFNYGLSLGKKSSSTVTEDDLYITAGKYVGKTESEFKTIAENLTLKPNHKTIHDDYSDTVAKGNIVWHGSGQYEQNETFNYGLSLGKKSSSTVTEDDLYITSGKYVGKTESEFKTIAENLTLKPNHKSEKDSYSDTVAKGNIVWHGYGQYEQNETFNYGLSLGKKDSGSSSQTIIVSSGQYVGKTESEFKNIAQTLGLSPTHLSERDSYSDTIAKGSIVTHGYGTYSKNEAFNYGLSLGKKESSSTNKVDVSSSYVGKSESEFTSYLSGLGLKGSKTGTDYSSSIEAGKVLSYTSGKYDIGDTVSYTISLGKKQSEVYIMRPQYYSASDTFEGTKQNILNSLGGFSNLSFEGVTSANGEAVGQIIKITVNGDESYSAGNYASDTPVVVYIVSKQGS